MQPDAIQRALTGNNSALLNELTASNGAAGDKDRIGRDETSKAKAGPEPSAFRLTDDGFSTTIPTRTKSRCVFAARWKSRLSRETPRAMGGAGCSAGLILRVGGTSGLCPCLCLAGTATNIERGC